MLKDLSLKMGETSKKFPQKYLNSPYLHKTLTLKDTVKHNGHNKQRITKKDEKNPTYNIHETVVV